MFIVHVAGHLGKDPETRFTPNGQKVISFTIAVNHRKGKEDITTWVRVTIWGDRFDKILPYLKKGSGVIVTGKMNPPTSYTDKEGRTQISLEIVAEMIDFSPFGKQDKGADNQTAAASYSNASSYEQPSSNYGSTYNNQTEQNHSRVQAGQAATNNYAMDEDTLPF